MIFQQSICFWVKFRNVSSSFSQSIVVSVLRAIGLFSLDTVEHSSQVKQFPRLNFSYLTDCFFPISFPHSHLYHCPLNIEEPQNSIIEFVFITFIFGDLNWTLYADKSLICISSPDLISDDGFEHPTQCLHLEF